MLGLALFAFGRVDWTRRVFDVGLSAAEFFESTARPRKLDPELDGRIQTAKGGGHRLSQWDYCGRSVDRNLPDKEFGSGSFAAPHAARVAARAKAAREVLQAHNARVRMFPPGELDSRNVPIFR